MNETPKATNIAFETLNWLYGLQRKAKIDLGRAEGRANTRPEELENLQNKVEYIDYLIGLVIKEI